VPLNNQPIRYFSAEHQTCVNLESTGECIENLNVFFESANTLNLLVHGNITS